MTDAKNVSEATKWCDDVRVLLKKRKGKSDELKGARDQIVAAHDHLQRELIKLKEMNPTRAVQFSLRFTKLAGRIKDAAASKTTDAALITAAAELAALEGEVQAAIEEQKALDAKLKTFDQAFPGLENQLAAAGGLRGARRDGTPVKAALDTGSEHLQSARALRMDAAMLKSGVDIETALSLLDSVRAQLAKANTAAQTTDDDAKAYLKAMKAWGTLKPQVQAALKELRGLPGAEAELLQLQTSYNTQLPLIKEVDGVWQGHDVAVKALAGFATILTAGRTASATHMAKNQSPEVRSALNLANVQLLRLRNVAPGYTGTSYTDECMALAESGRSKPAEAVTALGLLTTRMQGEADRMELEKTSAETARIRFAEALLSMETLAVPSAMYAPYKLSGNVALQGDFAERQWASAAAKLTAANTMLGGFETEFRTQGPDWKLKRAELEAMRKQAVPLISFPAVSGAAQALRDKVSEVLAVFDSGKLAASLTAYSEARVGKPPKTLAQALTDLLSECQTKKVPVDKPDQLVAFRAILARATDEVYAAGERTRTELRAHLDTLKTPLTPTQRLPLEKDWIAQVNAFEAGWQTFRTSAGGDVKELNKASKAAVDGMKTLAKTLMAIKLDALQSKAAELGRAEDTANAQALPKQVQAGIDELKAEGVDVSAEETDLKAGVIAASVLMNRLRTKARQMLADRAEGRRAMLAKVTTEIDTPLKKLPVSETYRKELKQQSVDIQLMVNTDDPELLAVAGKMQARMKTQLDAIAAKPKLYKANKTLLENQAGRIGDLKEKLPETQRSLETELQAELVLSKHTDPTEMAERVRLFVIKVDEGVALLAARDLEITEYRRIKTAVRAKWEKVKAIGDAPEFLAYYEARINDAKALKKVQGGPLKAQKILKALESKLDAVLAERVNPKAKLKALNAEEVQNHRLMLDMAQQYEREVSVLLNVILPQAKEVAKGSEDGDTDLVKSLDGVVSGAGEVVKPYLKNLTLLKVGAASAPDVGKMKADFESARRMLADVRRTAERLIAAPNSTNVSGPQMGAKVKEGLANLSRKWGERVHDFGGALRTVSTSVRDAAASDPEDVKASAEKAAKMIEGLASLFRSEAFASSFKVLMEDLPQGADKAAKETLEKKQLAAREAALMVMRQCRTDLQNPLLRKLVDRSNPFDAPTIKVAASGIDTVLKEIQLQALAA